MKEDDIRETIARYNERLEKFGHSESALGWSKNKNDIRFQALVAEWLPELNNAKICDFGCGFGDFFGYLSQQKQIEQIEYTGIDINESLVNVGRAAYPGADFWVGDIIRDDYQKKFDFIFSSGVFNHKLQYDDEYHFIEETLTKINALTLRGFAVNFLSDKTDYCLEHTFHSNPGKILDIVYKFSKNVVLRNDYMPYEFTVYVRKDVPIDIEKVIFEREKL